MRICLCGSTRFRKTFESIGWQLTLDGHVVYGLGGYGREENDPEEKRGCVLVTDEQKMMLDLVHLAKIEESDAILVLNVHDYFGRSTTRELLWAKIRQKKIYWLEPPSAEDQKRFDVHVFDVWSTLEFHNLPQENAPHG